MIGEHMPRNIVVTGGGTGIGRAVAAAFAGDRVVITGRRRDVLERTAKELGAEAIVCDHTDPAQIADLAAALDRVDVLVNNAGGNTEMTNDEPADLAGLAAAWRRQFETNLLSAVLTTAALADRLTEGGAVVHLGSIAADKGAAGYGAAKAGLSSYNVGLARELGPRGITSNVVSPGYIGDTEFFADRMTDARRTTLIDATFVGRAGTPDDIAGAVFYLASPAARYVTGQTIAVNGGAWPSR
jgi:3-oxoacyl-[acyl-carrier protein] reductase